MLENPSKNVSSLRTINISINIRWAWLLSRLGIMVNIMYYGAKDMQIRSICTAMEKLTIWI